MGKHNNGKGGGSKSSAGQRMSPAAASRVQSAGAKNPGSRTAESGFASRAQSAAAKGDGRQQGGR
ncbi:hypothetical protein [Streptomyces rimosus]|uniref:hypothetical protein n=1 Tax=Streptomyces rimosus TaxID=1927 RepID=UPI0037A7B5E1